MHLIPIILILFTLFFSYQGFKSITFFDRYKFQVDHILKRKEYIRLFSSGFLHGDWGHLIFNMLTLYFFSEILLHVMGSFNYLFIYIISLLGGSLLSLFMHRNHGNYAAIGASGAVAGVVFASIALTPTSGIGMLFIPIFIPAWVYGLLYLSYSIYSMVNSKDNIGHDAHLGGALSGVLLASMLAPEVVANQIGYILLMLIPVVAFIFLLFFKPEILILGLSFKKKKTPLTIDEQYNEQKTNRQKELDQLLDKVSEKGYKNLSKSDKAKLNELSNRSDN